MPHSHDADNTLRTVHLIHNSIIAHPEPVEIAHSGQFLRATGERTILEKCDSLRNPETGRLGDFRKLA